MVEPVAVGNGVGAVADPTPPVAVLYQSKLVPVEVKAVAVAFWQYVTVVVTVGAGVTGMASIIKLTGADTQPLIISFAVTG